MNTNPVPQAPSACYLMAKPFFTERVSPRMRIILLSLERAVPLN